MTTVDFKGDWKRVTWFATSPDAGHPACVCSYCGAQIGEDSIPLRVHHERSNREARFCDPCGAECFGLQTFPEPPEKNDHS